MTIAAQWGEPFLVGVNNERGQTFGAYEEFVVTARTVIDRLLAQA